MRRNRLLTLLFCLSFDVSGRKDKALWNWGKQLYVDLAKRYLSSGRTEAF